MYASMYTEMNSRKYLFLNKKLYRYGMMDFLDENRKLCILIQITVLQCIFILSQCTINWNSSKFKILLRDMCATCHFESISAHIKIVWMKKCLRMEYLYSLLSLRYTYMTVVPWYLSDTLVRPSQIHNLNVRCNSLLYHTIAQ